MDLDSRSCDDRLAMRRLGHVPALDGIRGIAILLVLGRHYFLWPRGGGAAGVDLFFVLSGFLIVSLFLEGRWPTLRAFYAARARRLLPGLLAMLVVYSAVEVALGHRNVWRAVVAYGFYTANVFQAWVPHVQAWVHVSREPLGGLWSLAQEEQFYLVAPVLILLVLRVRDERWLMRILIGLAIAVIAERTTLWMLHPRSFATMQRLYFGPDTHADGLLLGAVLAVWLRWSDRPRRGTLGLLVLLLIPLLKVTWPIRWPITTVVGSLAAMAVIGRVVTVPESLLARLLSWPPLRFIGRISYSLYLWQAAVVIWLHADANGPANLYDHQTAGAALLVAIGFAWLSYRFVEQPFRRRRQPQSLPVEATPATASSG